MFENLGWGEIAVLLVLALFVFGPEIGDVDLASLNPRSFVAKHLMGDDEEPVRETHPMERTSAPLATGEPAPWDPDTT